MAKFIIEAEESAVFQYEIEADNEQEARDKYFEQTASCSGKFIEAREVSILTISEKYAGVNPEGA